MESTLAIAVTELQATVGDFLGWGRGASYGDAAWSSQQQFAIDSICKSGIRRVLRPKPVEGSPSTYDWTWSKPTATLVLANGSQTVPLPDDFGEIEGTLTLLNKQGMQWFPVKIINEGMIRQAFSLTPTRTGRPLNAAVQRLKATTGSQGQRAQLFVFPTADSDYTLQFQYYVLPDYINGAFPYPMGGAGMAELYIESCLALAEQRYDDAESVHRAEYERQLAAAIGADRRNKPQTLLYNGDRSDAMEGRGYPSWHLQDRILYNGVQY